MTPLRQGDTSSRSSLTGPWDSLDPLGGLDDLLCVVTSLVALEEEFGPDDPVTADPHRARIGNSLGPPFGVLVQEAVSDDGLALRVGQQRESDLSLFGKG